jgi:hypothetical protein
MLSSADVFVNIAGGIRIEEPAAGLAVAAAVVSAQRGPCPFIPQYLVRSVSVFLREADATGLLPERRPRSASRTSMI